MTNTSLLAIASFFAADKRYDMEAKSPSQSFSYGLPKYSAETDNGCAACAPHLFA